MILRRDLLTDKWCPFSLLALISQIASYKIPLEKPPNFYSQFNDFISPIILPMCMPCALFRHYLGN